MRDSCAGTFPGAFLTEGSSDLVLLQNRNYNFGTSKAQLPDFRSRRPFNFSNFEAASKRVYSSIHGD
jgi:hypothetical protein